ncbi:MAG: WYL domain-containing protein [Bacteroidales bacterium]|nr:WYL domain-containing protein [Bacteroidales bacterium]
MPANKNAVTRYYIIDKLLANRYRNYSVADIRKLVNEELGEMGLDPVSIRTIQYDINYIENGGPFLADIEHYQIDVVSQKNPNLTVKKECLRYEDPSFSIFKKPLTEDEKYLLSEALSLLGQFDGLPNLDGLERLKGSLNLKEKRQIVSFTKNPLENSTLFGELFTAISQRQVIELHYHTFDDLDNVKQVVIHPHLLKEYNRRWYLFGSAEDTGRLLNFRLDQIDQFDMLSSHRYIPYPGDLNERFEDIIGVSLYDDRPLQTIIFWVSDYSKNYVVTKPIHESQHPPFQWEKDEALRKQYPMLKGGAFFSIECIENYELIRELTSFGKDLVVLSPTNIQQKVKDYVAAQLQAYQSLE